MPNRRYYEDRQRSNEPYNARSEYGRRRRASGNNPSEYDRGDDYYESDRSRYGGGRPGMFTGGDFGRGYGGERGNYPETFGGHGSSEGMYGRSYGYSDRTDVESEYQNRGRSYENRGDAGRDRSNRGQGSYGAGYPSRSSYYPESERGYYNEAREPGYYGEENRGWWDKAADEVSSWMGDEEAARRRETDHLHSGHYRGHGPRGYKRSDERIKEDINDRLTDHAYLDASEIEVEVSDGNVVLTGSVINRYAKRMAEDIVDNISGVKNVENRLRAENRSTWVAGVGDINAAGNRSKFQDISESKTDTKTMSKNA
ncbi:MAG TPA: BON domain-containing protein [Pyrinomonadaceae bacterium]|jgi:osmotically-inducible protein OsmY|nr:BON domain-containing protein [Pyrinomonadaceae bacterium]